MSLLALIGSLELSLPGSAGCKNLTSLNVIDGRFVQLPSKLFKMGLPSPNTYCGLFNRWIHKLNQMKWGNAPSGAPGYDLFGGQTVLERFLPFQLQKYQLTVKHPGPESITESDFSGNPSLRKAPELSRRTFVLSLWPELFIAKQKYGPEIAVLWKD